MGIRRSILRLINQFIQD